MHVDPHGVALTPDFRWSGTGAAAGRIVMVNDGGVVTSTTGASSWSFGAGLSTLGLVNVAVQPRPGQLAALTIQMGDNNGFFSRDGGETWRTQDYRGGDNDCSFADPVQPHRLIVFAPRDGKRSVFLYTAPTGQVPDASNGTSARKRIVGPPPASDGKSPWNTVSNFYNDGYRPLVLTLHGEAPRPDGDFVTIVKDTASARLMRTTAMSTIASHDDWLTSATEEGAGVKVFRQGPDLPSLDVNVVQASGGHANPVFFVGDPSASGGLWTWRRGEATWRKLVPAPAPGPLIARRFFVDPYRPTRLYVLDRSNVFRSDDGGGSWAAENNLRAALTENGAFPTDITSEAGSAQTLLRDMAFDAVETGRVFATGPAGVFAALDGATWRPSGCRRRVGRAPTISPTTARATLASGCSTSQRRIGGCCASVRWRQTGRSFPGASPQPRDACASCASMMSERGSGHRATRSTWRSWYSSTANRDDRSAPRFEWMRKAVTHKGMLDLLRDSFNSGRAVRIEFVRTSCTMARIVRVVRT